MDKDILMDYIAKCVSYDKDFNNNERFVISTSLDESLLDKKGRKAIWEEFQKLAKKESNARNGSVMIDYVAEKYEFPLPAAAVLPKDSHLWNYIERSKNRFPLLYGNDEFSSLKVLSNIFTTIGSVDLFENQADGLFYVLDDNYDSKKFTEKDPLKRLNDLNYVSYRPEKYEQDLKSFQEMKESYYGTRPSLPVSVYPMSNAYAKICAVGKIEMEESLVLGAYDLLNYLLHRPAWELSGYDFNTTLAAVALKTSKSEMEKVSSEWTESVIRGEYREWTTNEGLKNYKILSESYDSFKNSQHCMSVLERHNVKLFDKPDPILSAMPLKLNREQIEPLTKKQIAAREKLADRLMSEILGEEEKKAKKNKM